MSSARIAWRRVQRRLGPSGIAAVLALAAACAVGLLLPGLEQQTAALHAQSSTKRAARAAHPAAVAPKEGDLPEGLDEYVRGFPPLTQNGADLTTIFATADQHRVTLPKGEYQLKSEAGSPFLLYSATFPVRVPYATLKAFSADVLDRLPHAALDEMQLSRDSAGATDLESIVRFTLIYRGP